ncbi:hypothetical protein [Methanosarcina sp. WH1]|uniref:hypothetical protein n=1 Tax=Methanosarcina sp. WH1 TaxID=1434102 RepID=UPI00064FDFE8|nr:hypothetical protein [Methanosarcina sp. WH1]
MKGIYKAQDDFFYMVGIYIGQKLGSADRVRKQVDIRIPRSAGEVTFLKDGIIVEMICTTNMR